MQIQRPTVIIDKSRVVRNIRKMAEKAATSNVRFRPHFKTHQSFEIAGWFKEFGVEYCTVSSVKMAGYFANHGWQDITIAFIANHLEIEKIVDISRTTKLNLILDSIETTQFLDRELQKETDVWLKIDTDYHRTGIFWEDAKKTDTLIKLLMKCNNLLFKGILTHNGSSYDQLTVEGIIQSHYNSADKMNHVKRKILDSGVGNCEISIGDTPSCSLIEEFDDVDEIRPGNFVFNDLMQLDFGSCAVDDIAVSIACPVVGKYPDRKQIVIYGGGVHFAKEYLLNKKKEKIYGYVTTGIGTDNHEVLIDSSLVSLSQEHGIIQTTSEQVRKTNIGDILHIIPVHSCLTCNQFDEYMTVDGRLINRL